MTEPLFSRLPDIASAVAAAPHILLLLDYDGTLAPIVDDPGRASMPPDTRKALSKIAAGNRFSVAIISGRALPDLRERVRMDSLIYAGNHGLEISGPGLHFIEPVAARRIESLEQLAGHLRVLLRSIPGVEVENKVLTASVHFRRASPARHGDIQRIVESAVASSGDLFQVTPGLQVFEIRPNVDWNKGRAVSWIRETSGQQSALPVYAGDDATDEDAFAALPEGITVSVGRNDETVARYFLEDQESVERFLVWLAKSSSGGNGSGHVPL